MLYPLVLDVAPALHEATSSDVSSDASLPGDVAPGVVDAEAMLCPMVLDVAPGDWSREQELDAWLYSSLPPSPPDGASAQQKSAKHRQLGAMHPITLQFCDPALEDRFISQRVSILERLHVRALVERLTHVPPAGIVFPIVVILLAAQWNQRVERSFGPILLQVVFAVLAASAISLLMWAIYGSGDRVKIHARHSMVMASGMIAVCTWYLICMDLVDDSVRMLFIALQSPYP